MANLKESFSKGITALNVKTNNFIEENKCKTYSTTLENEIRDLKIEIGNIIYQKWVADEAYTEDIEPLLGQIKEKYAEIERQKQKIEQMQMEEKMILGSQNAQTVSSAQNTQAAPGSKKFCSQCGAPNDIMFKFCCKCGTPFTM